VLDVSRHDGLHAVHHEERCVSSGSIWCCSDSP
jgi:hypothetical protein